jgi:hypothetical protein
MGQRDSTCAAPTIVVVVLDFTRGFLPIFLETEESDALAQLHGEHGAVEAVGGAAA